LGKKAKEPTKPWNKGSKKKQGVSLRRGQRRYARGHDGKTSKGSCRGVPKEGKGEHGPEFARAGRDQVNRLLGGGCRLVGCVGEQAWEVMFLDVTRRGPWEMVGKWSKPPHKPEFISAGAGTNTMDSTTEKTKSQEARTPEPFAPRKRGGKQGGCTRRQSENQDTFGVGTKKLTGLTEGKRGRRERTENRPWRKKMKKHKKCRGHSPGERPKSMQTDQKTKTAGNKRTTDEEGQRGSHHGKVHPGRRGKKKGGNGKPSRTTAGGT